MKNIHYCMLHPCLSPSLPFPCSHSPLAPLSHPHCTYSPHHVLPSPHTTPPPPHPLTLSLLLQVCCALFPYLHWMVRRLGAAERWGQPCTTPAVRGSTLWGLLPRSAYPLGSGAAPHHSVCRVSHWEGLCVIGHVYTCPYDLQQCVCVWVYCV